MKKVLLFSLAFVATTFLASAQDTPTKEKQESKKKKHRDNDDNDGWNSWNDWNGGTKVRGEGARVTENRDVRDFTGVEAGISADIELRQSATFKVTLEGQKNILALVKTDLKNGNLKISFEKGYSVSYKSPLRVVIEAPSFAYLGMSGSGDVRATTPLSGTKLEVKISGSGDFDFNEVKYDELAVGISGSGDFQISGAAAKVDLSISGSGDLHADDLKAQTARCRISGSGDITLNVAKELDASISGSGDIRYSGKPASVKSRVSGSGDIEAK